MRPLLPVASIGILLCAIALSACDGAPPSGQAQADAATQAACRQRAEQAYEQQNRGTDLQPAISGQYAVLGQLCAGRAQSRPVGFVRARPDGQRLRAQHRNR